jgi:hypothetical protein
MRDAQNGASQVTERLIDLSAVEHEIEQLPHRLPAERWGLYWRVMKEALQRNISFAIGGGHAAMAYAGTWRDSKDVDLYVKPADRDRMIALLNDLGLEDYYNQKPYDRAWIFRACSTDTIVDVMWAMANQRAQVDDLWLSGPEVQIEGERIRVLPPEEMLWSKLYVLQNDRCDWPDALNVLNSTGATLNWRHMLDRLADDAPLLGALLVIFRWLCPAKARELPAWLWQTVGLGPEQSRGDPEQCAQRARLLDSRPWFAPTLNSSTGDP